MERPREATRAHRPTRTRRSSAGALAALAVCWPLCACSPDEPASTSGTPAASGATAGADSEGARLYARLACSQCHGPTGAGLSTAPSLLDSARYWTREQLAEYLEDPRAWIEHDQRMRALDQRYPIAMPAAPVPLEERLLLADHVLGLGAASQGE